MAGDPTNVHVWETGDLYVFDSSGTFTPATDVPADVDTALGVKWLPCGLMLGDPGVELPREIDETDLDAWQLKRYRTKWKNGKLNGTATLLEDNEVVDDILDPTMQPHHVARHIAMEFVDSDTGWVERRFTKVPAGLFMENDSQSEEPKGRPVRLRFYPDSTGKLFTILKGITT